MGCSIVLGAFQYVIMLIPPYRGISSHVTNARHPDQQCFPLLSVASYYSIHSNVADPRHLCPRGFPGLRSQILSRNCSGRRGRGGRSVSGEPLHLFVSSSVVSHYGTQPSICASLRPKCLHSISRVGQRQLHCWRWLTCYRRS